MPIIRPTVTKLSERDIRDGNSIREDYSPDGTRTVRSHFTNWGDRYNVVIGECGYSQISRVSGGPPVRLERLLPLQHPYTSGAHAHSVVAIKGHKFIGRVQDSVAAGGGWAAEYKWASCEIEYRPDEFPYLTDEQTPAGAEYLRYFYLVETSPASEYLTFPTGVMKYTSEDGSTPNGFVVPFAGGMIVPTLAMKYRWVELPSDILTYGDPWMSRIFGAPTQRSLLGCVNDSPWPGPNGLPAGSLLLDSVVPIRRKNALGAVCYDIDINVIFKSSPGGWNYLFYSDPDGAKSGWYFVSRSSNPTFKQPQDVLPEESLYSPANFDLITRVQE